MLSKKYRPKTFNELVGQKENSLILKELLRTGINGIPPIVFTGPFGSGKTSASRIFAKAVLCDNRTEDSEPCNTCESCVSFDQEKNANYVEIDAASNGDVESIRNLREQTQYFSLGTSRYRITNIDEAHNITKAGFNALLKILENGSTHHIFLFCTNEPDKMIGTVRSRCWRFESLPVTKEQLHAHLGQIAVKESIQVEEPALELISKVTAPHIRDALNALDFLNYREKITVQDVEQYFQLHNHNLALKIFVNVKDDLPSAFSFLNDLFEAHDIDTVFEKLIDVCLTLESLKKGIEAETKYFDDTLLDALVKSGMDFLGISSFLLKVQRPLDKTYIKYLFLELNRILNNVDLIKIDYPHITVINGVQNTAASAIINQDLSKRQRFNQVNPLDIMNLSDERSNKVSEDQKLKSVNAMSLNWMGKNGESVSKPNFSPYVRKRVPVSSFESNASAASNDKKTKKSN